MTSLSDVSTIGTIIRESRQAQQLTQPDLALIANVGIRFVVDIENGKQTCQIGLVLRVMGALGLRLLVSHSISPTSRPETVADSGLDVEDDDPPSGVHP